MNVTIPRFPAEEMERQQIEEHVEDECDYTEIPCKYKGIGCIGMYQ